VNVWVGSGLPITEKSVDPDKSTAVMVAVPTNVDDVVCNTPRWVTLIVASVARPMASAENAIEDPSTALLVVVPSCTLMLNGAVVWALAVDANSKAAEVKKT